MKTLNVKISICCFVFLFVNCRENTPKETATHPPANVPKDSIKYVLKDSATMARMHFEATMKGQANP